MYMPVSRLYFFIRGLVKIAPKTEPRGSIPIRIDCAEDGLMVIENYKTKIDIGTEVISLRL